MLLNSTQTFAMAEIFYSRPIACGIQLADTTLIVLGENISSQKRRPNRLSFASAVKKGAGKARRLDQSDFERAGLAAF